MKNILLIVPLVLGVGYLSFSGDVCFPFLSTSAMAAEKAETKIKRATFRVEGMTCGSCEWSVEKKLKRLEGVKTVQASNEKKNVTVEYVVNEITLKKIIDAVNNIGYKAYNPKTI